MAFAHHVVLWMVATMLLSGCVSHDQAVGVRLATAYYPESEFPENEEYGLPLGAPAADAFISLTVRPGESGEGCAAIKLDQGELREGFNCYYEGRLSGDGEATVRVPDNLTLEIGVAIWGRTPEQPEGCDRRYEALPPRVGDEVTIVVEDGDELTIPFYIVCWKGID